MHKSVKTKPPGRPKSTRGSRVSSATPVRRVRGVKLLRDLESIYLGSGIVVENRIDRGVERLAKFNGTGYNEFRSAVICTREQKIHRVYKRNTSGSWVDITDRYIRETSA